MLFAFSGFLAVAVAAHQFEYSLRKNNRVQEKIKVYDLLCPNPLIEDGS